MDRQGWACELTMPRRRVSRPSWGALYIVVASRCEQCTCHQFSTIQYGGSDAERLFTWTARMGEPAHGVSANNGSRSNTGRLWRPYRWVSWVLSAPGNFVPYGEPEDPWKRVAPLLPKKEHRFRYLADYRLPTARRGTARRSRRRRYAPRRPAWRRISRSKAAPPTTNDADATNFRCRTKVTVAPPRKQCDGHFVCSKTRVSAIDGSFSASWSDRNPARAPGRERASGPFRRRRRRLRGSR